MRITCRKLLSILIVVVTMFSVFQVAPVQEAHAAIVFRYVPVHLIGQEKPNWCWAASAQCLGKYYNSSSTRTQTQIVTYIKGSAADVVGSLVDEANAAKYASISAKTFTYIGTSLSIGIWSYATIQSKINAGHPFIASAGKYEGSARKSGHAVVVYGWNTESGNRLRYMDPANGGHVFTDGTYTGFCDSSYNGRKYDGTVYAN